MSDVVIKVENLSKQYRIGSKQGYRTFRETLVDAAKSPFQRVLNLLNKNSKLKTQNSDRSTLSRCRLHYLIKRNLRSPFMFVGRKTSATNRSKYSPFISTPGELGCQINLDLNFSGIKKYLCNL